LLGAYRYVDPDEKADHCRAGDHKPHLGLADAGVAGGNVISSAVKRRRAMAVSSRMAVINSAKELPTVFRGRSSQLSQAPARPDTAFTIVRSSSSDVGLILPSVLA
jgi:hypothetical protein